MNNITRNLFLSTLLATTSTVFAVQAQASKIQYFPYKDITMNLHWDSATGQMAPQDLTTLSQKSGAKGFTLAFVTAQGANKCLPAWGGYADYSVASKWGAGDIGQFIKSGGRLVVSFGGLVGNYLSVACQNTQSLEQAYQNVISTYGVKNLDFDVEGGNLQNQTALHRMTAAQAALQKADPSIKISYTLPVLPSGLTNAGVELLKLAKSENVNIGHVNIMTMDYGSGPAPDPTQMAYYSEEAAQATVTQLVNNGIASSTAKAWQMLSLIPMIGVNDVWNYNIKPAEPEQMTLSDIRKLVSFAQQEGMTRFAIWSIDRDLPCNQKWASPTCSGAVYQGSKVTQMQQSNYQYSQAIMADIDQ